MRRISKLSVLGLVAGALVAHSASAATITDNFDYDSTETTLAAASGGTWVNVTNMWESSSRTSSPNIMKWKERGTNGVAGVGPFYWGLSTAYHSGTDVLGADQVVSTDFSITDSDFKGINDQGSFGLFARYQPGIGPGGAGKAIYGRILVLPDTDGTTDPTTANLWLRTSAGDYHWATGADIATLESTSGNLTMTLIGSEVTINAAWGDLSKNLSFTIDGSTDALDMNLLNAGAAGVGGEEIRAGGSTAYTYFVADMDNFSAMDYAEIPEPATMTLLGLAGAAMLRRRRA